MYFLKNVNPDNINTASNLSDRNLRKAQPIMPAFWMIADIAFFSRISIEMEDAGGNIIFSKSDVETSSFEVNVSGKVVVKMEADHHKGSFDIH